MWDCCFFFISDISYIFFISDTLFFTFSLRQLESQIDRYVKGHHVYKDIWTPELGETLVAQIEPNNNPVDKYIVCTQKFRKVAEHLKKGASGRFPKTIFFFLKGDPYSRAKTIISDCRCNLGDGEGL